MKKNIILFILILFISHTFYSDDIMSFNVEKYSNKQSIENLSEDELEKIEEAEIAEKGFQTIDKLKSTYKKVPWDGYTWRERENTYNQIDRKMTKGKLMSTKWIFQMQNQWEDYLLFYKDDVFKFGGKSTGVLVVGKYEIQNNRVILFPESSVIESRIDEKYLNEYEWLKDSKLTGQLQFTSKNVLYDNELVINKHPFYPSGVYKEAGKKGFVNGIPVLNQFDVAVMTNSIPFYKLPDISSQKLINMNYENQFNIKTEKLLAGTTFYILGRTKKKYKVENQKDYWYYIRLYFEHSYIEGWLFGKNFESYDSEKNELYEKTLTYEIQKLKQD